MTLNDYLSEPGAGVQLARVLGVTQPQVSQWRTGWRPVPVERCTAIEQATGGKVTRRDLRPDDWWLIWPELVTKSTPVPKATTKPSGKAGREERAA